MEKKKIEVRLSNPERMFTRCYHDFIDCKILTGEEKIIFLILKRYINVKEDQGEAFPTIEKIMELTGWGNKKVIKIIGMLRKKGVLEVKRRGLSKSNLYTIDDRASIWKSGTVEEMKKAAAETKEEQAIRYLKGLGYKVEKRKESGEVATTKTNANNPNSNPYLSDSKSKAKSDKSQGIIKRNGFHNFDQRDYSKDFIKGIEERLKNSEKESESDDYTV